MASKRKTAKKSPPKTSTKTSSKPAKTSATRKIPIQRVTSQRVSEPAVQSPSAGSLARHKAGLIAELKSERITTERQAAIRAELEQRPMSKTPTLSHAELRRVGP